MPLTEQHIVIEASMEDCFAVLTNYEQYHEFLTDIKSVVIERREEGFVLAKYELDLMMRVEYTLRLIETKPTSITWTLEESQLLKKNTGCWELEQLDSHHTKATYSLEFQLKGVLPPSVTKVLAGTTLPNTLQAFKNRIEGRHA